MDDPGTLTDEDIALLILDRDEAGLRALLASHGGRIRRILPSRYGGVLFDVDLQAAITHAAYTYWNDPEAYDEDKGELGPWFLQRCD